MEYENLNKKDLDKEIKRGIAYERLRNNRDFKFLISDIEESVSKLKWMDIPANETEKIIEYQTKAKIVRMLNMFITGGIQSAKLAHEEAKIREEINQAADA